MPEDRRLAAIMFTDIVGYTALMGSDEDKAFKVLRKNREIQRPIIKKYRGEWLKEMGDGILASFHTASDAVRCAGSIQQAAKEEGIELRIGIHEGEVVFEGGDVLGDGVNVASRLEEMASTGAIYISGAVYKDIKNKTGITTEFVEERELKNVEEPVKVYKVSSKAEGPGMTGNEQLVSKKKYRPLFYIIAGLIVVISAILVWRFLPSEKTNSSTETVDKSIAVLPFRNDSPDQKNEYFCNGMVETILTNLQKIGNLKVKSRTDVEQYRNPGKDLKAIARELNVAYILEGSVQKVGDNIRITAQLIEGSTGDHLWADNYDGKYTDEIFTFQSEVAKKVASSLHSVITPEEEKRLDQRSTTEIMAYDLFWRGMDMIAKYVLTRNVEYVKLANDLFDKALSIDPRYPEAIFGKGHAHKMVATITGSSYDSAMFYADRVIQLAPDEDMGYSLKGSIYYDLRQADLALEYYLKAIEINPRNSWSHAMLSNLYCYDKNDYVNGIRHIEKAIKFEGRDPYGIFDFAGWKYLGLGDYDKALKYLSYSINLVPQCYGNNNISGYIWTLIFQGNFQESLQFIDSICLVLDCETQCMRFRFRIYSLIRDYEQAERWYDRFIEGGGSPNPWESNMIALIHKKNGRENESKSLIENARSSLEAKMKEKYTSQDYYRLASTFCIIGNKESALQNLAKAVDLGLRYGQHDLLELDPTFENLQDDPEFNAIVKRAQDEKAVLRAQVEEMLESG